MVNEILIAIGLIMLVIFIHKKPKFLFKRRLETIGVSVAGLLIFSQVAPIFTIDFSLKTGIITALYYVSFTALVANVVYQKLEK